MKHSDESNKVLGKNLVLWYVENHRKLPWRETKDPYRIWLSEIMCQQTQVVTVMPYYHRFLDKYPTIDLLAKAEEDDVYKLWEGLGYYSRAKRLMLCAKEVVENYGGNMPSDYKSMLKLPGIGPYTAGAILSIAFNKREPAIDGNVMRVYSRLYLMDTDVGKPGAAKAFDPYVRKDLPEQVSEFNQGLMELGATICTPTKPKCEECPVRECCRAYAKGIQETLPVKTKKAKKKHKKMAVVLLHKKGQYMLEKRDTSGLLANLWGFPCVEVNHHITMDEKTEVNCEKKKTLELFSSDERETVLIVDDYLEERYGIGGYLAKTSVQKKHVFTHLVWDMTLYHYEVDEIVEIDEPKVVWLTIDELKHYALPTAFLKLLDDFS